MAGRPAGSLNAMTKGAKYAVQAVFDKLGGVDGMLAWAEDNRSDFYRIIYPKLLPLTLAGDADNPIAAKIQVEFIGKV